MTTDNPDPLEVLKDAVRRQIRAYHVTRQTYDGPGKTRGRRMHSGDDAAATAILAIIAQHYAPLVEENARLREADAGDAPDEITNLKERVSLLEDALDMAISAIDDHNKRAAFRSIRIEEFYKPVPQRSKIACLTDARQALGDKT